MLVSFLPLSLRGSGEARLSGILTNGVSNSGFFNKMILRGPHSREINGELAFQKIKDIILKSGGVRAVSFDKSYFVLVSHDAVLLFKLDESMNINGQIKTKDLNYIKITAISVSETRQIVAAANEDNDIWLFAISGNRFELIDSHLGNGETANFLTFSPDGSILAVVNYDCNSVSLFEFKNNTLSKVNTIATGLQSGPLTAQFSENGDLLALLCKKDRSVKVFSRDESDWKLRECVHIKDKQFLYFFDRDTLVIDYDDSSLVDVESVFAPSDHISLEDSVPAVLIIKPEASLSVASDEVGLTLTSQSRTLTKTSRPTIKGKTIPNHKVEIYINDTFLAAVKSNESGSFHFRVKNSLTNGSYRFNAKMKKDSHYLRSNFVNLRINKQYPLKTAKRKKR